jgi:hypothetical protein
MNRFLLTALVAMAAAAGCIAPPQERHGAVLAVLEGTIDPELGLVELRPVFDDPRIVSAAEIRQELAVVPEDRNGSIGTAAVANSVEFVVECNGVPLVSCPAPFQPPTARVNGCGNVDSFEMDVTLRSFVASGLAVSHIELESITNIDVPANVNSVCNSERESVNVVDDVGAQLPANVGLFRYGHLVANPSTTSAPTLAADVARWKFRNPGGRFRFRAVAWGQSCGTGPCDPGSVRVAWGAESNSSTAPVASVVPGNGAVIVAGGLAYLGPRTGSFARIGAPAAVDSGESRASRPFEGGDVNAIVGDGTGGAFVGGTFTTINGVGSNGLVHVLADGNIDAGFNVAVGGGVVSALAFDGTRLYVGGTFATLGGVSSPRLASVSPAGVVDASFAANAAVTGASVDAIAIEGVAVIVGGAFTAAGGAAASNLALLSTAGVANAAFAAAIAPNNRVRALETAPGVVYFGGLFNSVSGSARGFAAAATLSPPTLLAFNPNPNGEVRALQLDNANRLFVGGAFTRLQNTANRIAVVDATSGVRDRSFQPADQALQAPVLALAFVAPVILVGGQTNSRATAFNTVDGSNGGWPVAVGPNNTATRSASEVRAIAVEGDTVFLGGAFRSAGGVARAGIGSIDLVTGEATAFAPGTSLRVEAVTEVGANVAFVQTAGATRQLLLVDAAGAVQSGFPIAMNGAVFSLVADDDGVIYIAGSFTNVGGIAQAALAAVNSDGSPASWAPVVPAGQIARTVAIFRDEVYAGGSFTSINGNAAFGQLAAISRASTGAATPRRGWRTNAGQTVFAISPGRDQLVVVGNFATLDGLARSRVAAVDGNSVTGFAPAANGTVTGVAVAGNNVSFAGNITSLAGSACSGSCVQSLNGPAFGSFDAQAPGAVTVAVAGGLMVSGGTSLTVRFAD